MDNDNYQYSPVNATPRKPPEDGLLKVCGIVGLVMASPFIAFVAFFALVTLIAMTALLFGVFHSFAPWFFLTMTVCLAPFIWRRTSARGDDTRFIQQQQQIESLKLELLEARRHIMEIEEGAEFHRKLAESAKSKISMSESAANHTINTRSNSSVSR